MDPRSLLRTLPTPWWFGLAAVGWAALGLAFLGRPGEPRAIVAPPGIRAVAPGQVEVAEPTVPVVTHHDPARASAGLNLVTAADAAQVLLLDMDGTVLHRWHRPLVELVDGGTERRTGTWQRARLLPGGRLLVLVGGVGLVALDRDGTVLWKAVEGAHDDFEILPDGRIVVLSRRPRARQDLSRARIVVEDTVAIVAPDGAPGATVSLVDALLASSFDAWRIEPLAGDVLQTSILEPLPDGRLLLSMRRSGTLVVFDPSSRRVLAADTGPWRRITDVDVLPDGGLVVVDTANQGRRSRVIELAPDTRAIRWTRDGAPLGPNGGTAQRLPGGNTLITASDDGETVEIAPDGTVVWALGPRAQSRTATAYETERIPRALWEGP